MLLTLAVLRVAVVPTRFSCIMEVEGVTQKSLTRTLRQLEQDELVTGAVFPGVPPRFSFARKKQYGREAQIGVILFSSI